MANMELAIISGACVPYIGITDKEFQQDNSIFLQWIGRLKSAFDDVKAMVLASGSIWPYVYWRRKFVAILISKNLYDTLDRTNTCSEIDLEAYFDCYWHLFPQISWDRLFTLFYKLHLVPDLIWFSSIIDIKTSDYISVRINSFIYKGMKNLNLDLNVFDILSFLMSAIYTSLDMKTFTRSYFSLIYEKFINFINEQLPIEVERTWFACLSLEHTLDFKHEHLENSLQQLFEEDFKFDLNLAQNKTFCVVCERIIKTKDEKQQKLNNELNQKLTSLQKTVVVKTIEIVRFLQNKNHLLEFRFTLQNFLQSMESNGKKLPDVFQECFVSDLIADKTEESCNIAALVIQNIMQYSEQDVNSHLTTLQKTQSAWANESNLILILFQIHSLDSINKVLVCNLWNLFYAGFNCMILPLQIQFINSVFNEDTLLKTLFKNGNETLEKSLNVYFNHLDSRRVSSEQISKFCDMFVRSPKLSVNKLVMQAVNNEKQQVCLGEMFRKLGFISKIKSKKTSYLCDIYSVVLIESWQKEEIACVNSAINFVNILVSFENYFFLKEELANELIFPNLFKCTSYGNTNQNTRSEELSLKLIVILYNPTEIKSTWNTKKLLMILFRVSVLMDHEFQLWQQTYNSINMEFIRLLEEIIDNFISILSEILDKQQEQDKLNLHWIENVLNSLTWTTQIRFHRIYKYFVTPEIQVPSCIADICEFENTSILIPSSEINYGDGTGLVAWIQCFSVAPSLCPISSLKLHLCSFTELALFEKGFSVTLSQTLPYCTPNQWQILTSGLRLLILQEDLYVPFTNISSKLQLFINLTECRVVLSILQMFSNVALILFNDCTNSWTSHAMLLYYCKQHCETVANVRLEYPEFYQAGLFEQLFMLNHMFHGTAQLFSMIQSLPITTNTIKAKEYLVILLLDILNNTEKYITCRENTKKNPNNEEIESSSESTVSSQISMEEKFSEATQYYVFCECIEAMQSSSLLMENSKEFSIIQKTLTAILQKIVI